MTHASTSRRGAVAVQLVVCLIPLMGVAVLTLDGGLMLDHRRQAQAVADAAAMSAAAELYHNYMTDYGLDSHGTARACALSTAAANGYTNNGTTSTVTVNIRPQSGIMNGKAGHAEVIVQYIQPSYFSGIFGRGPVTVKARAVARGRWGNIGYGLIALAPTGKGMVDAHGNGTVTVVGAGVMVNSDDPAAAIAGGNGSLGAPEFDITGGYSISGGGGFFGTVNTGVMPMPDPLAYLPPVDPSGLPVQSSATLSFDAETTTTLNPGVYIGGIKASHGTVILNPGIYYLQGGGLSFSADVTLRGTGVMIYNAPASSSDGISINNPNAVTLSPITTGIYKGICIFQDRTSDALIDLTGRGSAIIQGTIYAASAPVKMTGNGGINIFGSQVICNNAWFAGNGTMLIGFNTNQTARAREIILVE